MGNRLDIPPTRDSDISGTTNATATNLPSGSHDHQYPKTQGVPVSPTSPTDVNTPPNLSRKFAPGMLLQKPEGPKLKAPRGRNILGRLPVSVKNHIVATVAEFFGTFMFLFFAFGGTQVVNGPANSSAGTGGIKYAPNDAARLLYISLSFGMSLMVTAWVFFRISGGLFNPAVTLGLALVGVVTPVRAVLVTASQIVGGIAAAAVVQGLTPGRLNVNTKLLDTDNDVVGMDLARGVFMEMFMTFQLVFTVFMLAAEKHRATFIAPVGIGLSLFIAELMSVYYTGGSLNPARSFGPSVIQGFNSDHWVYWVGPLLGSLLASGFYALAKAIKYETVNPNADGPADDEHHRTSRQDAGAGGFMSGPTHPGLDAGLGSWVPNPGEAQAIDARQGLKNQYGIGEDDNEKYTGGSGAGTSAAAANSSRGAPFVDGPSLEAGRV